LGGTGLLPFAGWAHAFQLRLAGSGAAGALLFSAAYVAGALLLGPVWLLTVIAGLTYPFPAAVALVSAVSTFAAAIAFLIARYVARRRVERFAGRNARFAAVDRAIARRGWKVVFLLRLSPIVPYAASNYLYGVTAIRFWPFLLASWIGMLPGTFLYVSLGAAGRAAAGSQRTPAQWAFLAVGLAATVAVTAGIARTARQELVRNRIAETEAS
jgi:uncharacterized membrane protein YdjX (TVP38/TMEM64 family)